MGRTDRHIGDEVGRLEVPVAGVDGLVVAGQGGHRQTRQLRVVLGALDRPEALPGDVLGEVVQEVVVRPGHVEAQIDRPALRDDSLGDRPVGDHPRQPVGVWQFSRLADIGPASILGHALTVSEPHVNGRSGDERMSP